MAQKIIGRKREIDELERLYKSDEPVYSSRIQKVITMDDLFKD